MEILLFTVMAAARCVPIAWMLPVFGGATASAPLRMGVGLMLGYLALPGITGTAVVELPPALLILMVARETAVGLTLGFLASLPFRAAEMAGRLADTVRGANMAEVLVPLSGERSSPIGALFFLVATLIFLELGGLSHLTLAIGRSYEAVPVTAIMTGTGWKGLAALMIAATAGLVESAVGLAAPMIVALLLADFALAMIARAVPQVPVFFVGMPLKALAGVAVVLLSLGGLRAALGASFADMGEWMRRGMEIWR